MLTKSPISYFTKSTPCWLAFLFRKSITYKRTLIVSCYYYNISTLIACGFQNRKSSIFFYIGFRAGCFCLDQSFLLYCSPPHGFISSIKISYSCICNSSWDSFYKTSSITVVFRLIMLLTLIFIIKPFYFDFKSVFTKNVSSVLGIITMYLPIVILTSDLHPAYLCSAIGFCYL